MNELNSLHFFHFNENVTDNILYIKKNHHFNMYSVTFRFIQLSVK